MAKSPVLEKVKEIFAIAAEGKKETPENRNKDEVITRGRLGRKLFFLVAFASCFIVPVWVVAFFMPEFWWLGIVFGFPCFARVLPHIMFHVPELQALTSLDRLTGAQVAYGPGWHPRYPWEEVHANNNISLKEVTESFTEEFPTKKSSVQGEFSFGYRPRLKNILQFRAVDPTTVKEGFQGFVESNMAARASQGTHEDLLGHEKEIDEKLQAAFEDPQQTPSGGKTPRKPLEEEYGIDVTFVKVNRFKLPDEVQEALNAIAERDAMERIVAKISGYEDLDTFRAAVRDGTISKEELRENWDKAMIISGESGITRQQTEIKVTGVKDAQFFGGLMALFESLRGAATEVSKAGQSMKGTGKKKRSGNRRNDNKQNEEKKS